MKITAGGVPLGDDFFAGRQVCVDQIANHVSNERNVLILGPRRTGKTSSIQEYLRQREEKSGPFPHIFLDLESTQTLYEFYLRLIKEILQASFKYTGILRQAREYMKEASTRLAAAINLKVDLSDYLGIPETTLNISLPKFDPATVDRLNAELSGLLKKLDSSLLIVLDELPELVWKFGSDLNEKERLESRTTQTRYLLSGLRTLRQEQNAKDKKHQIIIAGSINLDNTLRFLDLEATINDLERLQIPYLKTAQATDLLNQLLKAEGMTLKNDFDMGKFIEFHFGDCSPFYIQAFANKLRQKKIDNIGASDFSLGDFQAAYKGFLLEPRGPEYLYTRVLRFYSDEKTLVFSLLKEIAKHQFTSDKGVPEEELGRRIGIKDQKEYTDLLVKMIADDLVQSLGTGNEVGFQSRIICNYWNYRLVDGRFLR